MTLKPNALLLLLCLYLSAANAQLHKGDYFLDGYLGAYHNLRNPNYNEQFSVYTGISYSKMITKQLRLGGSLADSESRIPNSIPGIITKEGFHHSYQRSASLSFRWYFGTKRWAPFAFAHTTFTRTKQTVLIQEFFSPTTVISSLEENKRYRFRIESGMGFNYFLTKNIMIESILSTPLYTKSNLSFSSEDLSLRTNYKFFFGGGEPVTLAPLKDQLLRTGSMLLDGYLIGGRRTDSPGSYFEVGQSTTYFVGNRTSVNAHLNLSFSFSPLNSNSRYTAIGVHQYVDLTDALLCSFQAQLQAYTYSNSNYFTRNTTIPLSFHLHYFNKRYRYFAGAEYTFHTQSATFQLEDKYKSHRLESFLGLDYYLARNVLLHHRLTINWTPDQVPYKEELPGLKSGLNNIYYSFGFLFLI